MLSVFFGGAQHPQRRLPRAGSVDPEKALSDATDKFIDRCAAVEDAVRADGKRMEDLPLSVLDTYWDRVKANRNGENT